MSFEELHLAEYTFLRLIDWFCILCPQFLILRPFGLFVFGIHVNNAENVVIAHCHTFCYLGFEVLKICMLGLIGFNGKSFEDIAQRLEEEKFRRTLA